MAFGDDEIISVPFRVVVLAVAGLPASALVLCIACALLIHFQQATSTHCGVQNWLPSLSAAVASFSPEKHIWRVLVGAHCGPRFFISLAFRNYLLSSPLKPLSKRRVFPFLCNVACALTLMEITSLLLLTSISSTDSLAAHAICFGTFGVTALLFMILSTYLFNYSGRRRAFSSDIGERSFEWKCLSCSSCLLCSVLAGYFFYRHNAFCEPNIYTFFALAEYGIIVSNIIFHSTLHWDFHGKMLMIGSSFGGYQLLPTHANKNT